MSLLGSWFCLKNLGTLLTKGHFIYLTVRDILFEMEGHLFDREDIYLTGRDIYYEKGNNFVTNY